MFGCQLGRFQIFGRRNPGYVAISVVALSLSVAGCASKATPPPQARVYQPPVNVAANQYRLRIEDDGIEEQLPPRRSKKPVVDDPTEPFSPNYGRAPVMKRSDAGALPAYKHSRLPGVANQDLAHSASRS